MNKIKCPPDRNLQAELQAGRDGPRQEAHQGRQSPDRHHPTVWDQLLPHSHQPGQVHYITLQ